MTSRLLHTRFRNNIPVVNGPVFDIQVRSDNFVYLAGAFTQVNGVTANQVCRLTPSGTVDTTFSTGSGIVASYSGANQVSSLMLADDGGVYLTSRLDVIFGTYTYIDGGASGAILKLLPSGVPDPAFTPITGTAYSYPDILSSIVDVGGSNYLWAVAWTSLCQFNKYTGALVQSISRNVNSHYLAVAYGNGTESFWEMQRPENNESGTWGSATGWNSLYLRDFTTGNLLFYPNSDSCCYQAIPIPVYSAFPRGGLIAFNTVFTSDGWENGSPNTSAILGSSPNNSFYGLTGNGSSSYSIISGWNTTGTSTNGSTHTAPLSFSTANGGRWYFSPWTVSFTLGGIVYGANTLIRATPICGVDSTWTPRIFNNQIYAAVEHPTLGLLIGGMFTNYTVGSTSYNFMTAVTP